MKNELTGTIKALLDEYRKAIGELILVIKPLANDEVAMIRDEKTANADCRSVQTILTHVVYAGFGYTNYIENHLGLNKKRPPKEYLESAAQYVEQLNSMLDYCENFFSDHPSLQLDENDNSKKITTNWGQQYDIDQLMEHAIVHILKHRRQIERFIRPEKNESSKV